MRKTLIIGSLASMLLGSLPASAENMLLPETSKWLVVASRMTFPEARSAALAFENDPDGVRIVRAKNGRFAIVLGPTPNLNIDYLKSSKNIPFDSYLSGGSNFLETLWVKTHQDAPIARPQPAMAASGPDHSRCDAIFDGASRLACHDELNGRPAPSPLLALSQPPVRQPASSVIQATANVPAAPAARRVAAGPPVAATSAALRSRDQDIMNDVMSDRIELKLTYENKTDRTVVGVAHAFEITNAFGEVILKGQDNLDIRIPPYTTVESDILYFWDDNPFISKEPYDRLVGPVSSGAYSVSDVVQRVIFDDGTSQLVASN